MKVAGTKRYGLKVGIKTGVKSLPSVMYPYVSKKI